MAKNAVCLANHSFFFPSFSGTNNIYLQTTGWNALGEPAEMTSEEFIARVWQHENDHLDGILIIDKMSAMDRLVNRRAIRDLERSV